MYFNPYSPCPRCYGYPSYANPVSRAYVYGPSFPIQHSSYPSPCHCTCTRVPKEYYPTPMTYSSYTPPTFPLQDEGRLLQSPGDLVPVIIQFTIPALLEKFPGLSHQERMNHPYLVELKQKYDDWIHLIREKAPNLTLHHLYNLLISGIAVTLPKEAIEKIKTLPFIKGVYPDEKVTTDSGKRSFSSEDMHAQLRKTNLNERNLDRIHIPEVWEMRDPTGHPLNGRDICIAVLERGFHLEYLNFGPEGRVIDQYNFNTNNKDVSTPDRSRHGTLVAQVILDVAPNALLLAYATSFTSELVAGMERAVTNNAQIINISLGSADEWVTQAANTAVRNGVVVVNSAGNETSTDSVDIPGDSPFVLSVGATNQSGDQVAPFSNYNPSILKPDVVAPGYYHFNSITRSGTSFAAPYVSGSIALLKQMHPDWSVAQMMSALATTATPILEREAFAEGSQGAGRIDVLSAIQTDTFLSPTRLTVRITPNQTQSYVLTIENKSDVEQVYSAHSSNLPPGIVISMAQKISVPPREAKEFPISIQASITTIGTYISTLYVNQLNKVSILLDIQPASFK